MQDDILTIEEAAIYLKLSQATVRNLLKKDELPGRRIGKQWRLTRRSLLDYVDEKNTSNVPETE